MNLNKNNVTPIKIIPVPSSSFYFTSMNLNVDNVIMDNSLNYTHLGKYTVSCSSFANNNTSPYYAFNNISSNYWQCDYNNNTNFKNTLPPPTYTSAYSQNPYTNSNTGNSTYQGGGSSSTKWITSVSSGGSSSGSGSTIPVIGEWIQIKIPVEQDSHLGNLYLYSYSILTPIPIGSTMTFPTKFVILGSDNNGDTWNYVDQQNLSTPKDTSDQMPVVFNLNSTNSYHCYRLVITEMPPNNSVVRINQFALIIR